jgi:hypothetical protein
MDSKGSLVGQVKIPKDFIATEQLNVNGNGVSAVAGGSPFISIAVASQKETLLLPRRCAHAFQNSRSGTIEESANVCSEVRMKNRSHPRVAIPRINNDFGFLRLIRWRWD